MKKTLILLFIFFSISQVYAEDKVAFLDIDLVIKNSNYGKKLVKKLNDINSKNLISLKKDEEKLIKLEDDINSLKNVISKSELEVKINNLKKEIKIFNKKKEKINNEFELQRKNELNKFLSLASPLIEEFMKTNSIKIILDKKNLFIADPKYDITNDLVNLINLKIKNE